MTSYFFHGPRLALHSVFSFGVAVSLLFAPSASIAQATTVEKSNTTLAKSPAVVLVKSKSGVFVTTADVMSELQRFSEASQKATLANPDTLQQLVTNLLIRRELADEALKTKLNDDPVVAAAVAIAKDRVLSDARLIRVDAQNAPPDAALEAYAKAHYAANAEKYDRPAQTRARHILISNAGPESLAKAKEVLAQLRAGANFEEMAKLHSTDRSNAERGGDLGYFAAGKMVPQFEEAVAKLEKPGDTSELVETQFGYHIIRLEDRRAKGRIPFEELREKLTAEARATLLNDARIKMVDKMKERFEYPAEAIAEFSKSSSR